MRKKEIIELIETKENWNSEELVELIMNTKSKPAKKPRVKVTFYHIGGYELLRDGTQEEEVKSIEDMKEFLSSNEMEFDDSITDMIELAESIEKSWSDRYDDGGGSGWLEY